MYESEQTKTRAAIIGGKSGPGPGPFVLSADTLEGNRVENFSGQTLGEVKAIMLDVPTGRVAYAVLSFGGFLGLGEKLFAVPWKALTLDADEKCFKLNVTKEKLADAPGFDKDHWPTFADPNWAESIHGHYGIDPYWK